MWVDYMEDESKQIGGESNEYHDLTCICNAFGTIIKFL